MLMLAWFAALLVMMGLPWAYTRAFGSDWQTVQPMRSYHVPDRRTCDYRLAGKLLEHNLRGYLCIDRGTYAQSPAGAVTARLIGQRSWLGMAVEDVQLSAPDQRSRQASRLAAATIPIQHLGRATGRERGCHNV